ncbi:kinase-like protein [Calocera cornea HHB12733]|uniref:Kinase-like protein n=1 Tax=Calocera cornea HHB12733 TaxID=1353952 RepID=A0A165EQV5_9BASI|nr:kinase-like protein [Calocera cornea HHB12733]
MWEKTCHFHLFFWVVFYISTPVPVYVISPLRYQLRHRVKPGQRCEYPSPEVACTSTSMATNFPCIPCGLRLLRLIGISDQSQLGCTNTWELGPLLDKLFPPGSEVMATRLVYKGRLRPDMGGAAGLIHEGILDAQLAVAMKVPSTPPATYAGTELGASRTERYRDEWQRLTLANTSSLLRRQLFVREAWIWKKLNHENIVPFLGIANFDKVVKHDPYRSSCPTGTIALVSQWMEGGIVTDYMQQHPDVSLTPLILDIVAGLTYLHAHDIVHADLKPNNILVDLAVSSQRARACLTDFGLSYGEVDDDSISESTPTSYGGNPHYIAFERILSGQVPYPSIRTNGGLLDELLSKRNPPQPAYGVNDAAWALMEQAWRNPNERPSLHEIDCFFREGKHIPGRVVGGNAHSVA